MKKIVIIGGGISGLSCAYDLNKRGFDIEIYERNKDLGGQSRSINYGRCSVEYAWRIWTSYYTNFIEICKKIPTSNNKTIFNNLVKLNTYNESNKILNKSIKRYQILPENHILNINKWKSKKEYFKVCSKLINMILMSDERLKKDDITFIEYIDPQEKASVDFCHEFVGPIMGMEATKATLFCISKGFQTTYYETENPFNYNRFDIYVTNAPYSEAIFIPWVKYLKKKGVKIYNNSEIVNINYNKNINKIVSINTRQKEIYANDFVFCLDQTSIAKLIIKNKDLMNIPTFNKLSKLMYYGNEYYLGIILFFSEESSVEFDTGCSSDQPWKPVFQRFSMFWEKKYINNCKCKEIWQVSVLNLVKGHNNKTLIECSVEEARDELFFQLKNSSFTGKVRTKDKKSIWNYFIDYQIWPDWKNNSNNKIYNVKNEYKLSINKGCLNLMSNYKTEISNVYIGSVIAKGDVPMISQEIACTNGRRVANILCKKYNKKPINVNSHNGSLRILLYPIRLIDKILFYCGINIDPIIIFIIILIVFLCIIIILVKKRDKIRRLLSSNRSILKLSS